MTVTEDGKQPAGQSRLLRRELWMFVIALGGMGFLGALAMFTALTGWRVWEAIYDTEMVMLPICFAIGAVVGIPSYPLVRLSLFRLDLRIALPLVYGGAGIVVIWYTAVSRSFIWPLNSAIPAFASVCVLSVVAHFLVPRARLTRPDRCPECDYDLTGVKDAGCPECGWRRT